MMAAGAPAGTTDVYVDGRPDMSYAIPGRQIPGTGYDKYIPMLMGGLRGRPSRLAMPRPVPRFPTPGRMDGMREAKPPRMKEPMMSILPVPAMGAMR